MTVLSVADLRTDASNEVSSPDSERMKPADTKCCRRNSVSVEQIQDTTPTFGILKSTHYNGCFLV